MDFKEALKELGNKAVIKNDEDKKVGGRLKCMMI